MLATDTSIDAEGGIPESDWWGDTLHTLVVKQNGSDTEFKLIAFADAGQHKEEYAALHKGIKLK